MVPWLLLGLCVLLATASALLLWLRPQRRSKNLVVARLYTDASVPPLAHYERFAYTGSVVSGQVQDLSGVGNLHSQSFSGSVTADGALHFTNAQSLVLPAGTLPSQWTVVARAKWTQATQAEILAATGPPYCALGWDSGGYGRSTVDSTIMGSISGADATAYHTFAIKNEPDTTEFSTFTTSNLPNASNTTALSWPSSIVCSSNNQVFVACNGCDNDITPGRAIYVQRCTNGVWAETKLSGTSYNTMTFTSVDCDSTGSILWASSGYWNRPARWEYNGSTYVLQTLTGATQAHNGWGSARCSDDGALVALTTSFPSVEVLTCAANVLTLAVSEQRIDNGAFVSQSYLTMPSSSYSGYNMFVDRVSKCAIVSFITTAMTVWTRPSAASTSWTRKTISLGYTVGAEMMLDWSGPRNGVGCNHNLTKVATLTNDGHMRRWDLDVNGPTLSNMVDKPTTVPTYNKVMSVNLSDDGTLVLLGQTPYPSTAPFNVYVYDQLDPSGAWTERTNTYTPVRGNDIRGCCRSRTSIGWININDTAYSAFRLTLPTSTTAVNRVYVDGEPVAGGLSPPLTSGAASLQLTVNGGTAPSHCELRELRIYNSHLSPTDMFNVSSAVTAALVCPHGIVYGNTLSTFAHVSISPFAPTVLNQGDDATSATSTRLTELGLAVAVDGTITGTPNQATTETVTIIFANDAGSVNVDLNLTIGERTLTYPANLTVVQNVLWTEPLGGIVSPALALEDTVSFAYAEGESIPGITVNASTGDLTGTPSTPGTYTVHVVATINGTPVTSNSIAAEVLEYPTVTYPWSLPYTTGDAPTVVAPNLNFTATGYTLTPSTLPSGCSFTDGTFTLAFDEVWSQAYTIEITGSPLNEPLVYQFTLTILPGLDMPLPWHYSTLASPMRGVPWGPYWPQGHEGRTCTYAVTPDLPSGLTLDPSSGALAGTPTTVTAAVVYTVTAVGSDGQAFQPVPLNLAVLWNPADSTVQDLTYTNVNVAIKGEPVVVGPLQFHADTVYQLTGVLPPGLTFDGTQGTISGTPIETMGPQLYNVVAVQGPLTVEVSFFVRVDYPLIYDLGDITLQDNVILLELGRSVRLAPSSSEWVSQIMDVRALDDLPPGLTVHSPSGVIEGVPQAASDQATYRIESRLSSGVYASAYLNLRVNDSPVSGTALPEVDVATQDVEWLRPTATAGFAVSGFCAVAAGAVQLERQKGRWWWLLVLVGVGLLGCIALAWTVVPETVTTAALRTTQRRVTVEVALAQPRATVVAPWIPADTPGLMQFRAVAPGLPAWAQLDPETGKVTPTVTQPTAWYPVWAESTRGTRTLFIGL